MDKGKENTAIKGVRIIKIWLIVGLIMILGQISIGGITRLTGSGLSITKWEIVTGAIPPLDEVKWQKEFELYQQTPQYHKINNGMSLSEFKFIYFWEFFHRLWARSMGFVFAIPFLVFLRLGMLPTSLIKKLLGVVFLAAIVASFGWIMVASGLVNRPWVNAYKLTIHLCLGFSLFCYLLWITIGVFQPQRGNIEAPNLKKIGIWISIGISLQIMLGGLMSGMKAGLFFPTWPDMNGEVVPSLIFNITNWNVDNFVNYDKTSFLSALVQTAHRLVAYTLIISVLWYFFEVKKRYKNLVINKRLNLLVTLLVTQIFLGIITLINCKGSVPVFWGVLHQACGLLLLSASILVNYQFSTKNTSK